MGKHWIPDGNGGFVEAASGLGIGLVLFLFMGVVTVVGAPFLIIVVIIGQTPIWGVISSAFQILYTFLFFYAILVVPLLALGLGAYYLISIFAKR